MKTLQAMTLAALTVAMGVLAYELCMTVTTLGGYAPLALITAALGLDPFETPCHDGSKERC